MKKSLFLLIILALTMNSCFHGTGVNTTPQMQFGHLLVNPRIVDGKIVSVKDTLFGHSSEEFEIVYVDTLQLGDTVMFTAFFDSYMNNLVNVNATVDTTRVKLWFQLDTENEQIRKLLASGSDPQKGVLNFNPMYYQVSFPVFIVPQEVGSHPVKITVVSDSEYSMNSALFTLPVK